MAARGVVVDQRAGALLWRGDRVRTAEVMWADPVATTLLGGCQPQDALALLRRDVLALAAARRRGADGPTRLERRLVRHTAGEALVARSSVCSGVLGLTAVTTLELERAPAPSARGADGAWGLSPRELEVARLAADGLGNRAIAFRLGIAAATVGVHLTRVFRKTGALDRQGLTRLLLVPQGR